MWYFTWILGLGLALGFGIINALWLEASYAFGELDEARTRERFETRSDTGLIAIRAGLDAKDRTG